MPFCFITELSDRQVSKDLKLLKMGDRFRVFGRSAIAVGKEGGDRVCVEEGRSLFGFWKEGDRGWKRGKRLRLERKGAIAGIVGNAIVLKGN